MTDEGVTRRVFAGGAVVGFLSGASLVKMITADTTPDGPEFSEELSTKHATVNIEASPSSEYAGTSPLTAEVADAVDGLQFAVLKVVSEPEGVGNIVWQPDGGFYGRVFVEERPDSITLTTVAGGETESQKIAYTSTNERNS